MQIYYILGNFFLLLPNISLIFFIGCSFGASLPLGKICIEREKEKKIKKEEIILYEKLPNELFRFFLF